MKTIYPGSDGDYDEEEEEDDYRSDDEDDYEKEEGKRDCKRIFMLPYMQRLQYVHDSQQYPVYLINNVEDIVVFLGVKVFNSDNFYNAQVTPQ